MSQRPGQEIGWVPKTKLGRQVQQGEIISMEEIFTQGLRIKEPEIVDTLLPNIQQEVLGIGFVQKQTDAGERSRFRAVVAIGNGNGFIGIGEGKARQVRDRKSTRLNSSHLVISYAVFCLKKKTYRPRGTNVSK